MKAVVLALVVALAGCAAKPPVVVDRVVNVAIPVKCEAERPQRPVMPTEVLAPDANEFEVVRAALAEIEVREGYEVVLVAALNKCLNEPAAPSQAPASR